jgi:hypothetical protein
MQCLADFHAVAKVFWVSYSAYSRGIKPAAVDNLLRSISEECNAAWHELDEFKQAWHEQYQNMIDFYVKRVNHYAKRFMNSAAGMILKRDIDKSRKGRRALPAVDHDTLRSYRGAQGLNWTRTEVAHFFHILSTVGTTGNVKESVCP